MASDAHVLLVTVIPEIPTTRHSRVLWMTVLAFAFTYTLQLDIIIKKRGICIFMDK